MPTGSSPRGDLGAVMLTQAGQDRFVGRWLAVITTERRPGVPGLIWREAIRLKR